MTYTILGHCPRSGSFGIGIATYSLAVGSLCPSVLSNRGALTSQALVNPELRVLGTTLLGQGHPASQTIDMLTRADPWIEYRQLAVLDREGRIGVYTGPKTRQWTGHRSGCSYIALGNVLAGEHVVEAMASAFEASAAEPLADRLMLALEAGRDAGGQASAAGHLPERSAALLVHGRSEPAEVDLRVDVSQAAVDDLRRIHDEFRPYVAYHRQRWLDPRDTKPQEEFVRELADSRSRRA